MSDTNSTLLDSSGNQIIDLLGEALTDSPADNLTDSSGTLFTYDNISSIDYNTNLLVATLPQSWFSISDFSFIKAVMSGFAQCMSFFYANIQYAKVQTRINTANDGFLDLISGDFLGNAVPRLPNEVDSVYRARIMANVFLKKVTKPAIQYAVTSLFPDKVVNVEIFESVSGMTIPNLATPIGHEEVPRYDYSGRYGSILQPYETWINIDVSGNNDNIVMENNGGDIVMEDGVTQIDYEWISTVGVYPIVALLKRIKPISTVIWLTINKQL